MAKQNLLNKYRENQKEEKRS